MSTDFTRFLREQAEKHAAATRAGKATVEEWRGAVERLFEQIRAWLAVSDPDGIIEIQQGLHETAEPGLGRYKIPRLDLRAFGKWAGLVPKARNTIGSAHPPQKRAPERAIGRVDITDELRRYVLYRFRNESGGELWVIDDPATNAPAQPLDQTTFQQALMSYFR